MTRGGEARIQDIIEAAGMAARITAEGRSAFYDDWKNIPVAAQMISIIGAAASRLSDTTTASYPDIPWDDIRGMRNFIAHEYHNIEPEIVWETLRTSIPELVRSLGEEPVRPQR
ncbi:DUF86 domain-containing protein [Candidatus Poriferisodalis sp.]|uniref:HepT-like ribonuclease domain-containing protein n=1 Tax=Candidatus Poriferisodalis sp. TaxID=3101277 RepID=UPI003B52F5BA